MNRRTALKAIGASPSTKFVLPLELVNVLKPFLSQAEGGKAAS